MHTPNKQRYHFAASAFARIYTPPKVTSEMLAFCETWAETKEQAPLDCLHSVDRYFRKLWDTSQHGF